MYYASGLTSEIICGHQSQAEALFMDAEEKPLFRKHNALAVLVEDLETGVWGGRLIEVELP